MRDLLLYMSGLACGGVCGAAAFATVLVYIVQQRRRNR